MLLSDIDSANNLVDLFLKRADERRDDPFLGVKRNGAWQTISWGEAADQMCVLAENLRKMGLAAGDRVIMMPGAIEASTKVRPLAPIAADKAPAGG